MGIEKMAGSQQRRMKSRTERAENNVNKRGSVPDASAARRKDGMSAGPIMITFFLIVVVGSSLVQIIRTAQTKGQSDFKQHCGDQHQQTLGVFAPCDGCNDWFM